MSLLKLRVWCETLPTLYILFINDHLLDVMSELSNDKSTGGMTGVGWTDQIKSSAGSMKANG